MQKEKVTGVRGFAAAAGVALCAALAVSPGTAHADFAPSFAPLVDRVKGAVVNIATTETRPSARAQGPGGQQVPPGLEDFYRHFFGQDGPEGGPRPGPMRALGSGFIVDPSGFVVTNNHVVENATDIKVTMVDGTTYKATLVGKDEGADLAVLKVDAGHSLPSVPFGDSDKARVGDWVISVGNPFGLENTVTAGIVSAIGRDKQGLTNNAYVDFIQIDAPINQGNSGGPTFNESGEVIGINSQILSPNGGGSVGIGFAIPSNLAKSVVGQLEKTGHVSRGLLGVQMTSVTPEMEDALGLSSTNGVLVNDVTPDGPAAKAGLKSGDVIVGFGDHPIKNMHDLGRDVADTPAGQSVQVKFLREGKPQTVGVTIQARNDEEVVAKADEATPGKGELGLDLAAITQATRQQFNIKAGVTGAVVTGVDEDGPAGQLGIREGDVIVRIDNVQVQNPADVSDAVKKATKSGKKAIAMLVHVHRGDQNQFVAVPLGKDAG